jgi:toxin ParE1/3/4
MGRYKLSGDAKEDLRRIYRYGVLTFGEAQADRYYDALIERFAQIANEPSIPISRFNSTRLPP